MGFEKFQEQLFIRETNQIILHLQKIGRAALEAAEISQHLSSEQIKKVRSSIILLCFSEDLSFKKIHTLRLINSESCLCLQQK